MTSFHFYVFQVPNPFKTVYCCDLNPYQQEEKLTIDAITGWGVDLSMCTNYKSLKGEFVRQFMTKEIAFYVFEWRSTVGASSVKDVIMPTIPSQTEVFFPRLENTISLPEVFQSLADPKKVVIHDPNSFDSLLKAITIATSHLATTQNVSKIVASLNEASAKVQKSVEYISIKPELMFNQFYVEHLTKVTTNMTKPGKCYEIISQKEGFLPRKFSEYSRSRVDFGITPVTTDLPDGTHDSESTLVAGILNMDLNESPEIVGGIGEREDRDPSAQLTCGAIQIAADLAVSAMRRGTTVDQITIWGLSICLETNSAKAYKLILCPARSTSCLLRSIDAIPIKEAFERLLRRL